MQFGESDRTFEKGKYCTSTYLWSVTEGNKQYRNGLFNTTVGRFGFIQISNAPFQYSDVICILTSRGFLACVASVSVGFTLALAPISRGKNTVPWSFFAPQPHGNACYAG